MTGTIHTTPFLVQELFRLELEELQLANMEQNRSLLSAVTSLQLHQTQRLPQASSSRGSGLGNYKQLTCYRADHL